MAETVITEYPKAVWVDVARKYIGVAEAAGTAENKSIRRIWSIASAYLSATTAKWVMSALGHTENTPWCGAFLASVMVESRIAPPNKFWSTVSWRSWGTAISVPTPGCIVVYDRSGGGHVGIFLCEDSKYDYVLGGNQSNAVNVMKLDKTRRSVARWPPGQPAIFPVPPRFGRFAYQAGKSNNEA